MKTYKKLWNRITSFENLTKAFYRAKKGRPGNPEILRCFFNLEKKLFHIQEELVSKKYKTEKYKDLIDEVLEAMKTLDRLGYPDGAV